MSIRNVLCVSEKKPFTNVKGFWRPIFPYLDETQNYKIFIPCPLSQTASRSKHSWACACAWELKLQDEREAVSNNNKKQRPIKKIHQLLSEANDNLNPTRSKFKVAKYLTN